jgi:hypothetical protein
MDLLEEAFVTFNVPPFRVNAFLLAHDTDSGDMIVGASHEHGPGGAARTRGVIYRFHKLVKLQGGRNKLKRNY